MKPLPDRLFLALGLFLLAVAAPVRAGDAPAAPSVTVLILGDSLTAGYGLDPEDAYPAVLQRLVDDRHWPVRIVNGGLSGETTAGGKRRLAWLLKQPVDILVIALGGNDGLRGIPVADTRANLAAICADARAANPKLTLVLAGMQMPPNLGPDYTAAFRQLYPDVAREQQALLIPFLLANVGDHPELNQADGIHPTAEGQKVIAQTVWQTLEPLVKARLPQ